MPAFGPFRRHGVDDRRQSAGAVRLRFAGMARPVTTAVMSARVLLAELNRPDSKTTAGGKANTTDEQAIAPCWRPR